MSLPPSEKRHFQRELFESLPAQTKLRKLISIAFGGPLKSFVLVSILIVFSMKSMAATSDVVELKYPFLSYNFLTVFDFDKSSTLNAQEMKAALNENSFGACFLRAIEIQGGALNLNEKVQMWNYIFEKSQPPVTSLDKIRFKFVYAKQSRESMTISVQQIDAALQFFVKAGCTL